MTRAIHLGFEGNDTFWHWFAGFWEGEGSACFLSEPGPGVEYRRVRLSASQAVRDPLDYIVAQLGVGTIHFRAPKRRKKIWWIDTGTWIWSVDKRREVIAVAERLIQFTRYRTAHLRQFIDEAKALERF